MCDSIENVVLQVYIFDKVSQPRTAVPKPRRCPERSVVLSVVETSRGDAPSGAPYCAALSGVEVSEAEMPRGGVPSGAEG